MANRPIHKRMDSGVTHTSTQIRESDMHLLRACLALGTPASHRVPARIRLEQALGPAFARRLLAALSLTGRS